MDSHARLHAELTGFLRQYCPVCDERHLALPSWMVTGLLLSETVCFDHWKAKLPMVHCLAARWQRRCRRWLANERIDAAALYGPLVFWAIQHWQKPGQALHLALDTTVLWNRCCVVTLSVVCHGRAIPLLWQTLEHPSASVSAELLGWFEGRSRWRSVMRLRCHGSMAPQRQWAPGAPAAAAARSLPWLSGWAALGRWLPPGQSGSRPACRHRGI